MFNIITRLVLATFLVAISCTLLVAAGNQDFRLELDGSTLSMRAKNVPLSTVLHEFERQTSIRMRFIQPVSDLVTAEFSSISVDKAISLLLRNYNHSLTYRKAPGEKDRFISEIVVSSKTANHTNPMIWITAPSSTGSF